MLISDLLIDLGLSTADTIRLFRDRVRDRDDVRVFRCEWSQVIFLESTSHISVPHYREKAEFTYWSRNSRAEVLRENRKDDERQAELLGPLVKNQKVARHRYRSGRPAGSCGAGMHRDESRRAPGICPPHVVPARIIG